MNDNMRLVELAQEEYFPFNGQDFMVDRELNMLARNYETGSHKFRELKEQQKKIKANADELQHVLEAKGFKSREAIHRHYVRQHGDITEILSDGSIELHTDTERPFSTRGVHLYHAKSVHVDDLLRRKKTDSVGRALEVCGWTGLVGNSVVLLGGGDLYTLIAPTALALITGGIVGAKGAYERSQMRPTLISKGTDEMPNSPLLELTK